MLSLASASNLRVQQGDPVWTLSLHLWAFIILGITNLCFNDTNIHESYCPFEDLVLLPYFFVIQEQFWKLCPAMAHASHSLNSQLLFHSLVLHLPYPHLALLCQRV